MTEKHEIDGVFVLLLFVLFAGSILMVLLLGASSYEKLVQRGQESYNARTGIQYIAAKLRHNDEADCVQVGSFSERTNKEADEIETLYLRMGTEEEYYYTKIYYYDGYIRVFGNEEGSVDLTETVLPDVVVNYLKGLDESKIDVGVEDYVTYYAGKNGNIITGKKVTIGDYKYTFDEDGVITKKAKVK